MFDGVMSDDPLIPITFNRLMIIIIVITYYTKSKHLLSYIIILGSNIMQGYLTNLFIK